MILKLILAAFALLSLGLMLWQWLVARRFPLHQRADDPSFAPPVTLLKPLRGSDLATESCLRSWLAQDYPGPVQILFGVASADDTVCPIVNKLLGEFPAADARLVVCGPLSGANAKVAKLVELTRLAKHDLIAVSDADVLTPKDFLKNAVVPLRKSEGKIGLVNCFYRLANPATLAMRWEAIAINADFWSQVLQARSLKPIDFALGAFMMVPRKSLEGIGGFESLKDCLADDYQLGHRIAHQGQRIEICPVVVECWSAPMNWSAVWNHQLRWARTIRVSQPLPYFFSILSNPTLWPLIWLLANPTRYVLVVVVFCWLTRLLMAADLQIRLTQTKIHLWYWWLSPIKDLCQAIIWLLAFAGNHIEWRGERMRLRRDGTLLREQGSQGAVEQRS